MPNTFTEKVKKCMTEDGHGPFCVFLYFISVIYSVAVRIRAWFYVAGVFKSVRLGCKVISVGNITVGGSGKTPVTMHVAELLKKSGYKVLVLSRGYGRSTKGMVVVSDGIQILRSPSESGDEPYLMATRLKGVPVVVGEDRVKAGKAAIELFKPDVIVLDDGFQHLRLCRDLNIALIDGAIGLGNGYLLPRGIMREGLPALLRADMLMVKGTALAPDVLRGINGPSKPLFNFTLAPQKFVDLKSGKDLPLSSLKGARAVAVAGLASPEQFFKTVEGIGVKIVKRLAYPDHHAYIESDLQAMEADGAEVVITTEKDGVKLVVLAKGIRLGIVALSVDAPVTGEDEFKKIINNSVKRTA
ncbi:tetraacyldisaccharide 4'-kinase [bacterium]|nr:MAG: tetraacyldisaccharide 4'-kinase [bacterium]